MILANYWLIWLVKSFIEISFERAWVDEVPVDGRGFHFTIR